ncbi:MAG: class I SAM-dependent methyltransferase [Chitinophagaceae bacterium]|nr:class I SAM-dependent methyltransferase [Oligoflexus sp.]
MKSGLWIRRQERFEGLVERCAPGAHRALAAEIAALNLPREARILDVAAGSGAFLARLRALGFANLHGIELDIKDFKLDSIPIESFDLNLDFADRYNEKFDLITAVEIIEHLDNPRHFLRELRKLLRPGGYLLVTCPNTEQWIARFKFLIKGEPKHFGLDDIKSQRHISPILSFQMLYMFQEIGYKLDRMTSVGSFWGPLKAALYEPLGMLVSLFMRGNKEPREINVYIAKQSDPTEDLQGQNSRYFESKNFDIADHQL